MLSLPARRQPVFGVWSYDLGCAGSLVLLRYGQAWIGAGNAAFDVFWSINAAASANNYYIKTYNQYRSDRMLMCSFL